ncbi:hypothetical protein WEI85_00750 [Actinomycetes bacterium KLBMP 9797]
MPKTWPTSPLAAAQRAFDLLVTPPAPLAFDCRGLPSLPQRIVPLDELKRVITDDATPRLVRDQVWRELVIRARRDGPPWVIAVVGLAMPGLRRMAGMLARGWHGDTRDRDAELLAGFLDRLRTVDLNEPRICGRLIDAGARAVKRAREREEETDTVTVDGARSLPPQRPFDHPDWVLARAQAAAVIGPEDNRLIGATRLDEIPLQLIADELGISVEVAAAWRRKAELRLVEAVADGELDRVSLVAAAAAARRRRLAASVSATADTPSNSAGEPAAAAVPASRERSGRGRELVVAGTTG